MDCRTRRTGAPSTPTRSSVRCSTAGARSPCSTWPRSRIRISAEPGSAGAVSRALPLERPFFAHGPEPIAHLFSRLMAGEYIFTMRDLRKVVPPSREILKGIYLSFFPGAKIGVLGSNGAGKSTLLRIMAGVDKDFLGEARPLPGIKIGYLPQEPQLDPARDVRGNVTEGVKDQQAILDQFNAISARFAEPMDEDEMTALLEKQGNLQERIDALGLWELD